MSALEERVAEALRTNGNTIPEIDAAVAVRAVYDELTRPGPTRDAMVEAGAHATDWFIEGNTAAIALDAALAVAFADDTQEQP